MVGCPPSFGVRRDQPTLPGGTSMPLVCYEKKCYVAAARLFAEALTADPKPVGDPEPGPRYAAACAAALAGCGRGDDAGQLDGKELARWRKLAVHWLRADLQDYGKRLLFEESREAPAVQQRLRIWQSEPAFAGLRDATMVGQLSADGAGIVQAALGGGPGGACQSRRCRVS